MELRVSELRVPLFYFYDERAFCHHLKNLMKSKTQEEY